MEGEISDIDKTRRNVLRSAVGLGSLGATALFATGTVAAQSPQSGDYGYEINKRGYLEYNGDQNKELIQQAVEGMNNAKEEGLINFAIKDGYVVTQQQQTLKNSQVLTGQQQTISPNQVITPKCHGANSYNYNIQWNGVKHTIKLDYCNTLDIIDLLIEGAATAQVAAIIAALFEALPAAAVSECVAVIFAAGWQILANNNNGRGVEIIFFLPNIIGVPSINPQ